MYILPLLISRTWNVTIFTSKSLVKADFSFWSPCIFISHFIALHSSIWMVKCRSAWLRVNSCFVGLGFCLCFEHPCSWAWIWTFGNLMNYLPEKNSWRRLDFLYRSAVWRRNNSEILTKMSLSWLPILVLTFYSILILLIVHPQHHWWSSEKLWLHYPPCLPGVSMLTTRGRRVRCFLANATFTPLSPSAPPTSGEDPTTPPSQIPSKN